MRRMIYDVATTLDGFIARPDGSFADFVLEGAHGEAYQERLAGYSTVVMGRKTYEAGYAYGLVPGQKAYPHMDHHIVSKTLDFGAESAVAVEQGDPALLVADLKTRGEGTIYLCGGGELAGYLLDRGAIDEVLVKLNPVVFGDGIPLFGSVSRLGRLELLESTPYDNGVILLRYACGS